MNFTHYVSLEASIRTRGLQRTICGVHVEPKEHRVEPTCPVCIELLRVDDLEREATLKALAAEFPDMADQLLAGVKA